MDGGGIILVTSRRRYHEVRSGSLDFGVLVIGLVHPLVPRHIILAVLCVGKAARTSSEGKEGSWGIGKEVGGLRAKGDRKTENREAG